MMTLEPITVAKMICYVLISQDWVTVDRGVNYILTTELRGREKQCHKKLRGAKEKEKYQVGNITLTKEIKGSLENPDIVEPE